MFPITEGPVAIQPLISHVVGEIENNYQLHEGHDDDERIPGTPTGFTALDKLTLGLHAGEMIIVTGRPAVGKTTFSLNIAEYVGVELKLPVVFFSLGFSGTKLARRLLSSVSHIDQIKLRSARLADEDWDRLTMALSKLHEANIHIDETSAINPNRLSERARHLHRQHGQLGLIVIDHLQLLGSEHENYSCTVDTTKASRMIKALAKELQVPVILVSQLSSRVDCCCWHRPQINETTETCAIESHADLVIQLHRYDANANGKADDSSLTELHITKNCDGARGALKMTYLENFAKFVLPCTGS